MSARILPGDTIVIDGVLEAFVRAICTPEQIRARIPGFARFTPGGIADTDGAGTMRAAVITFDAGAPDGRLEIGVILETGTGWETLGGDPLTIARIDWSKA